MLLQIVTTFGFPYSTDFSKLYRAIWSVFPPNLLAEALNLLGKATATAEDEGINWHRRGECPAQEPDCVITIVCSDIQICMFIVDLSLCF